jgi:hypothetical protein
MITREDHGLLADHLHALVRAYLPLADLQMQEARQDALARAKRIFEMITSGKKPQQYEYLDRPVKEEILKVIGDGDSPIAMITRNRYGAQVLNCANAMFVDIDFPRPKGRGLLDAIALMFSSAKREARQQEIIDEKIQKVEQWAASNPDRSFRLYRTREGLRLLFTDRLYDPTSEETAAILSELESDFLYVKLTQKQESFRARLTSKPWRCASTRPPNSFPWDDAKAESMFREWENAYEKQDKRFKVCELIKAFGSPAGIDDLAVVVKIHDQETRISAKAELA